MMKPHIFLLLVLFSGCVPLFHPRAPHVTGTISGKVVDVSGRPVANTRVIAIYVRGWTQIMPPVPNWFVVGEAIAGKDGAFSLTTGKRVDKLHAQTNNFKMQGYLDCLTQNDNVIHIK
jgi:hypothetical protein